MLTLAATNTVAIWLFAGQMVFNLIVGLAMWWGKAKLDKIDQLERDVQHRADQAISNRFGQMHAELQGSINQIGEQIKTIFRRLEAGEKQFAQLGERDQNNELKLEKQVRDLTSYIHQQLATKQDLHEMYQRIEKIELDRAHERGRREQAHKDTSR